MASTTSTQDSGLFGYMLPIFKAKTGIAVHVIAQGTGQALDTGRRGDADVVFVHARSAEMKFLEQGFSTRRWPVMYNDFIIVGPKSDPAKIAGSKDAAAALRTIAEKKPRSLRAATIRHQHRRTAALEGVGPRPRDGAAAAGTARWGRAWGRC